MQTFFDKGMVQTADRSLKVSSWKIPADLKYFEGHFPHLPVLPAVAIIDISLAVIQAGHPQQTCQLQKVLSAKFHQPLAPGTPINIVADEETGEGSGQFTVEWRDASTSSVAAQLRLHVGR